MALSKIDRGFDSDLADVFFLLRNGMIKLEKLEVVVANALTRAKEFSLNPITIQEYLEDVKRQLVMLG